MVKKFKAFNNKSILESTMFDLILESKLIYKENLIILLNDIKSKDPGVMRVKMFLKYLYNKDIDKLKQNYIDIDQTIDKLTFIPDNKIEDTIINLSVDETSGGLDQVINHSIIDVVGISRDNLYFPSYLRDIPSNEWIVVDYYDLSKYDADLDEYNIYYLKNVKNENYYIAIACLKEDDRFKLELPENLRGGIKIGRFINNLKSLCLKSDQYTNEYINSITESDIEKFVNILSAKINHKNNMFDFMEVVEGEDIRKWYLEYNYDSIKGDLGNSCMKHSKCQDYFDIYIENPEVCKLLILKNSNGDKIQARALLWQTIEGDLVMDRIYAYKNSLEDLFKHWADKNGYKHSITIDDKYTVAIKNLPYDYFPYMDTFSYYNFCDNLDDFEQGHGEDINYPNKLSIARIAPSLGLTSTSGKFYSIRY